MTRTAACLLFVVIAGALPAHAQQPATSEIPPQPVVVTTGEGVVKRAPDRAWVTIAVESRARSPQDAQLELGEVGHRFTLHR